MDELGLLFEKAVSLHMLSEARVDELTDAVACGTLRETTLIAEWSRRLGDVKESAVEANKLSPAALVPAAAASAPVPQPPPLAAPASVSTKPLPPLPPPPHPEPPLQPPSQQQLPQQQRSQPGAPAKPPQPPSLQQQQQAPSAGAFGGESALVGMAMGMCTEAEALEREACLELSRLEYLAGCEGERRPRVDLTKAVKRYQRPAAGAAPPSASELRPLPVLRRTVSYLLRQWTVRQDVPSINRYTFISDRLRAVQQDMTVQRVRTVAPVRTTAHD